MSRLRITQASTVLNLDLQLHGLEHAQKCAQMDRCPQDRFGMAVLVQCKPQSTWHSRNMANQLTRAVVCCSWSSVDAQLCQMIRTANVEADNSVHDAKARQLA